MNFSKSLATLCLIFLVEIYFCFIYFPKWEKGQTEATISWDTSGYYFYLPAIFIYKDLKKCAFKDPILKEYTPTPGLQQAFLHSSGNYVMKYSSGQAIILSPAFFAAHLYCKIFKTYKADGFSLPYQFAVSMWGLFISFLGLFFLRKILLLYFTDLAVAFTLISISIGSNYLDYACISSAMTHNTLFTLYAILIFFVIQYYQKSTWQKALFIGLLTGLATLTRPTEIISLVIPLLWGISNFVEFKDRIYFFLTKKKQFIIALIAFVGVASIQLFYWKYVADSWIVYSYQDQGFDWFKPHIYNCLFHVKAGWLLYSPILAFAILGFPILFSRHKSLFWGCFLFAIPFTYLCFAWHEWFYGWSFGQRAMIQSYPIWAFPMTAFYSYLFSKNIYWKVVLVLGICLGIAYSLFWKIRNFEGGLFRGPEMTDAYFFSIVGRINLDKQVLTTLDNPDNFTGTIKNPHLIYENNFDLDTSSNAVLTDTFKQNKQLLLDTSRLTTAQYYIEGQKFTQKWLQISADFTSEFKEWETSKMHEFVIQFIENGKPIQENRIKIFRLLEDNQTKRIHFFAKRPSLNFDSIEISFRHPHSSKKLYIDLLKVEEFE